jgi:hypothetical protein
MCSTPCKTNAPARRRRGFFIRETMDHRIDADARRARKA